MTNWLEHIHPIFIEHRMWSWLAIFVLAALCAVTVKAAARLFTDRLRRFAERTSSIWDDVAVDLVANLKSGVVFAWVFLALAKSIHPSPSVLGALSGLVVALTAVQIGIWGHHLIRNWREVILKPKIDQDPSSSAALGLLYTGVQAVFIVLVVLGTLSNLGVNVGALLAGLGVGGIAVALAAQNILGDLLASLSIVLDKPFAVGDYIVAGEDKGTVEHIGIKTTRLRSLSGEELVVSNKDLLESRIQNFKRLWQRRVRHRFGVVYSTPADVLEKIPDWVKSIVEQNPKLRFDRCHFAEFGASSLDFELVFFVTEPDYNVYMDYQQRVLLDIFRKLSTENVDFAFPSQSVYVEKFSNDIPR